MNSALSHSRLDVVERAIAQLNHLRQQKPRVHCLTNAAAQVFTANLLLAAGAIPSLTIAAEEVPFFTAHAQAVLINLGTLDAERRAAFPRAIAEAKRLQKPWVLDPVFVEASPPRLAYANELLRAHPAIMRCNEAEFAALTASRSTVETLKAFAREHDCVVALTGPVDQVTDGTQFVQLHNGHAWMSQTTAMGCAGTALIAALMGSGASPFEAALSGLSVLGVVGEIAASRANGPGSFVPAFLDTLSSLSAEQLHNTIRVE